MQSFSEDGKYTASPYWRIAHSCKGQLINPVNITVKIFSVMPKKGVRHWWDGVLANRNVVPVEHPVAKFPSSEEHSGFAPEEKPHECCECVCASSH